MQLLFALATLLALAIALCLHLRRASRHDLQQAALLPFADDPEAAARMSAATGQHCERLFDPRRECRLRA
ncbi:hypothetical protein SAMN05216189_101110 [Pseudomonas delhiensis]|uniref:Uncharacterized protein n=1 Tax=Pseudomonas delhiensis TaxID=366289 RepID=A0A239JZA2_9PSED|nr:hypothetical protein [Pseudomonas delhiensis]SDI97588.1 hypothetical protein SAMN05216189_101110 [Pseudomonas delhiensis]SNT10808.1 hypothetical protein SAMN06295949_11410 [Pseudomonas delhiensis]